MIGRHLLKQIAARDVVRAGATGSFASGPVWIQFVAESLSHQSKLHARVYVCLLAQCRLIGTWGALWDNYLRLAPKMFAGGVAPTSSSWIPKVPYFQIPRRLLWAATMPSASIFGGNVEGNSDELIRLLAPFAKTIRALGKPPGKVSPADGAVVKATTRRSLSPERVLPFLSVLHEKESLDEQRSACE